MTEMMWTPRMREVGLRFGMVPERVAIAAPRRVTLPDYGIVLITGPSGSGKTTILRQVAARLRAQRGAASAIALDRIRLPARAVVDCVRLPLEPALALLCRAGLAEPRVWLRTPGELSEGERFRLRLALWMAGGRRVLIADEFANSLDRVTARAVAWQLHNFMDRGREPVARDGWRGRGHHLGRLAILATAHEDLAEDLMPAVHVDLNLPQMNTN